MKLKKKIISIAYIISTTNNIPTSKKTLHDTISIKNTVIYSHLVNENKYEYMNNVLKQHDIHYDFKKEFIIKNVSMGKKIKEY